MCRNWRWHIIFLLFFPIFLGAQPNQKLITEGDNSPAIYAKNVSLQYDVSKNLVHQLLDVFDQEGMAFSSQKERVERLIQKYKKLAAADIRDRELTEASKKELGVAASKALENVLEWDIYIQTEGDNSPAILALGDVQIRYDVPAKAFIAIAKRLLSQSQMISNQIVEISNFQQQLNGQIENYKKLEQELAFRYDKDEVAQKAYALLEKGELDAAFRLLEEDYFSAKKRTAFKAYELALAKHLTGDYDQVERFLREARDLDPENARYWQASATLMLDLGYFDRAEPFALKAIHLDTLAEGKQAESLAAAYRVLGTIAQVRKKLEQAWTYFDQARQLDSLHQSPDLSLNLNGMGQVRSEQYRYEEAMYYYYRAFQVDSSFYGARTPRVAGHLKNVALIHKNTNNLGAALELFNLVLDIDTTAYGFMHPEVAGDFKNIGRLYEAANDYEPALVFHQLALSVDTTLFPPDHPTIAGDYKNLGLTFFHLGEIEQAYAFHQQSLAIDTLFFPPNHPTIGANYTNLGMVYLKKKDWAKARNYFEDALRIDTLNYGTQHPESVKSMMNLGAFYYETDDFEKAIFWQERCVQVGHTLPGVIDTYQEDLFFNLAAFYDAQWQWLGIQEDTIGQKALLEKGLQVIEPFKSYTVPLALTLKLRLAKWHIAAFQNEKKAADKEIAQQLVTEITDQIEGQDFGTVSDQWMELEFLKIQLKGME